MSNDNIQKPVDPMRDPDVKVERTVREFDGSENDKVAKYHLEASGIIFNPPMAEYLGSIAIHFYRNVATNTIEIATQNQVGNLSEQIAAIGIQQAMYVMMERYGHQMPSGVK